MNNISNESKNLATVSLEQKVEDDKLSNIEDNAGISEVDDDVIEIKNVIHYQNVEFLKSFLTDYMKIKPRTITNLSKKQQAKVSKAIKRARANGLIPYIRSTSNLEEALQEKENKSEST